MDLAIDLRTKLAPPTWKTELDDGNRSHQLYGWKKNGRRATEFAVINDERVLQVLIVFNRLARLTWRAGKIPLTMLLRLRKMQLSELCPTLFSRTGKLDKACRFGMLAFKFCERFPIEEMQSHIFVYLYLQIIKSR